MVRHILLIYLKYLEKLALDLSVNPDQRASKSIMTRVPNGPAWISGQVQSCLFTTYLVITQI